MIDLKVFSKKVEEHRKQILSRLKRLKQDDPFSNSDRSLIVEPGTDAAALFGHEQAMVMEQRLKDDLKEIETALRKIKKGTFGICERCGNAIEAARLEVKPAAIYCLKCEKILEKKTRRS